MTVTQSLADAVRLAPVPDGYAVRAIRHPLTADGYADRISIMFEGRLYERLVSRPVEDDLVCLVDPTLTSDQVRKVLREEGVDRVLEVIVAEEAAVAAAHHAEHGSRVLPLSRYPITIPSDEARRIYVEAARRALLEQGSRERIGKEVSEMF